MADQTERVQRLRAILAREREALLVADFAALNTIGDLKEHCMTGLDAASLAKADLVLLSEECARNQALVAAAQAGLSQAKAQLAILAAPASTLTYAADGATQALGGAPRRLSSRS
jgi:hypothetical protein